VKRVNLVTKVDLELEDLLEWKAQRVIQELLASLELQGSRVQGESRENLVNLVNMARRVTEGFRVTVVPRANLDSWVLLESQESLDPQANKAMLDNQASRETLVL